ncbi:MAG: lipase family protein [Candidatus Competibacteraceae bacterium]|nr:lipase family protein [Candidatus Competibacteraceae bacterium]
MVALSPKQAAEIARGVYAVRREADLESAYRRGGGLGIQDLFTIEGASRFTGTSGSMIGGCRSGFGYLARGSGSRQGEVLIAIRGTKTAADWWTDANIGFQRGPSDWPVHRGFNETFNTFVTDLDRYLLHDDPTHIHCVGHSLGGALATLAADYLYEKQLAGVSLYTFGSPRVGGAGFSRYLTRRMGAENIYRVFHDADPISMLPIFPFLHLPDPGSFYRLEWIGGRVAVMAHHMQSYLTTLGEAHWRGLGRPPDPNWEQRIEGWLEAGRRESALAFSATTLTMIGQALAWIIKKIALGVSAATTPAAGVTVLDQLAGLLRQGVLASRGIARYLKLLIGRIFQFLGRGVVTVTDITTAFVRWILDLLYAFLANIAYRTLLSLG